MDQIIAEIKKIPPVTRFLCGSSLGVTLSVLMKAVSPYSVLFVKELVTKNFQLWRLYTSFFLGGGGINYIFEFVMLYRTANDLEARSYTHRSADLAWQLFWACGGIILATMPLRTYIFARPLLVCLIYLYSALAPPGSLTSIMGLISVPVTYYPYVMVGLDLIMAGPQAAAQSVAGAVVGHLWWWTVWGGELGSQAPEWLRKLPTGGRWRRSCWLGACGVHVTAPRPPAGSPSGTATGHTWGSGTRLGN
ncbi:Der1-like family-domain-containing protein [Flammula alnicola]|nr:Der1-like family-domain-containing protein [Flammula alnicola]